MKVCNTVASVRQIILEQKDKGQSIGFIPTMGALHNGHLSLVEQAGSECSFVVVSIFVNPTQFNDKEDLARYPRNLEKDLELLSNVKCDLVFAPSVEEVYPEPDTRIFDFGNLDKVMEGAHRPGHFNGVGQVVSRLFKIVTPDKAFFGQKDFQQLAIIKNLVIQLDLDIEIVPCPIIREKDGLAMSSRNMLLDEEQRKNAPLISKTLFGALEMSKTHSVAEVKKWVVETIDKNPYLKTEYFEIVDDTTLEPIAQWGTQGNKTGCIAVHCGKIRLIDNVIF
jgi:pantoate--beta-alanine ligase